MPELNDLFPTKPVQVLRTGFSQMLAVIGTIIALVALVGLLIWQVPELSEDYKISRNYEQVLSGRLLGGSCKTKALVMVECDVKISYMHNSEMQQDKIEFMFINFDMDPDYDTYVIRSTDMPDKVTIALAVEKIWNRIAMVAVLALLLLGAIWATIKSFWQGRRSAKILTEPIRLHAVAADITRSQGFGIGASIDYSYKPAGGKRVKYSSFLNKKESLIYLSDNTALAALPEGSNIAILMDQKLLRVDFSDDERAAIIEKLNKLS